MSLPKPFLTNDVATEVDSPSRTGTPFDYDEDPSESEPGPEDLILTPLRDLLTNGTLSQHQAFPMTSAKDLSYQPPFACSTHYGHAVDMGKQIFAHFANQANEIPSEYRLRLPDNESTMWAFDVPKILDIFKDMGYGEPKVGEVYIHGLEMEYDIVSLYFENDVYVLITGSLPYKIIPASRHTAFWYGSKDTYEGKGSLVDEVIIFHKTRDIVKISKLVEALNTKALVGLSQIPTTAPKIWMLGRKQKQLHMKHYDITKVADIELDLHYGEGFKAFSSSLIDRMASTQKGVVLFHGPPGTGKTYYVRYLTHHLTQAGKTLLYIPTSLMESLLDPETMEFIFEWILQSGVEAVLLLEDAEVLLADREDERGGGMANLLNVSDGILNDITRCQFIATLNMNGRKIDPALRRAGRLLAEHQFELLTKDRASKLIESMGLKPDDFPWDDSPLVSLASIYAWKSNQGILHVSGNSYGTPKVMRVSSNGTSVLNS